MIHVSSRLTLGLALLEATASAQTVRIEGSATLTVRLDDTHSVVLTQGANETRLYVTSRESNQKSFQLDAIPAKEIAGLSKPEVIAPNLAYLHFYSDYGIYERSLKYLFDLASDKPPVKIRYGILSLTTVAKQNGKLYYSASFDPPEPPPKGWHAQHVTVVIQPRDGALPMYQITEVPIPNNAPPELPQGVRVANSTPPGQPHRPSSIIVGNQSYPAPVPTLHRYRLMLPQKQPPAEIESDIGPYVERDGKIWFATTFYDGEGTSGIGAIGSFDIRSATMRWSTCPKSSIGPPRR